MESFSSSSLSRPIHVYLSFKGDFETCKFTDRLWAALETDDLNTFWDDKKLDSGDSITLPRHFLKAIRQSNISIVVFSKNYASSLWCLEELSEIAGRIHEPRYTIFPIFYDVDPSEVQNQSNSFGKAFAEHEQRFTANLRKVHRWRSAMKQVANLSGWHVQRESGPQVIDDIIIKVKKKMRELVYADVDLVGMKSRVKEVEKLLDLGSNDGVQVVGICGMGGIGKSTLARVLYDKISRRFDASYFLLNLSEFYSKRLACGKSILIILDGVDDDINLMPLIKPIKTNWLGRGSRFIITTRDERVLKIFRIYDIYRVKLLARDEALQLFCRKAFKCDFHARGYEQQINRVLEYANGLPLAIVILGSLLYNTRVLEWRCSLGEIKKVANHMIMKVLIKSFKQLNYDSREIFLDIACFFNGKEIKYVEGILNSYRFPDKEIIQVKLQIQLIVEKSLMAIIDQKIQMHGLLQEMGREIVQCDFPSMPEGWSRLWDFNDIFHVMKNDTVTQIVEAVVLDLENSHKRALSVQALSHMNNLRLLILRNVKFYGALKHLSNKLRYISWHQYPFTCLPSSFVPHNLIELILPYSSITSIWEGEKAPDSCIINIREGDLELPNSFITSRLERAQIQFLISRKIRDRQGPDCCIANIWERVFHPQASPLRSMNLSSRFTTSWGDMTFPLRSMNIDNYTTNRQEGDMAFPLRNMNLSGSKNFIKMPNFKRFPYLERLDLEGCTRLSRLDVSIAYLSKIKFLNLRNYCPKLKEHLPPQLASLRKLVIENRKNLVASVPRAPSPLEYVPSDSGKVQLDCPPSTLKVLQIYGSFIEIL
ncbi:hypothetical protein K1719_036489 [Acacia pycnantha]|nr:hypothetical protein K1719_036489 [Acacia pycnantha]